MCRWYLAELVQTTLCLVDSLDPVLGLGVASLQCVLEGRQPGVELYDSCSESVSGTGHGHVQGEQTSAILGNIIFSHLAAAHQRVGGVLSDGVHFRGNEVMNERVGYIDLGRSAWGGHCVFSSQKVQFPQTGSVLFAYRHQVMLAFSDSDKGARCKPVFTSSEGM